MKTHADAEPPLVLTAQDLEGSLPAHFARVAQVHSQRLAVSDETTQLTYAGLNSAANRVAHFLLAHRGMRSEPVALLIEHGTAIVTAMWGVLKAGKYYCALPPSNPHRHNQQLLEHLDSHLILTDAANLATAEALGGSGRHVILLDAIAHDTSADDPDLVVPPDTLAALHVTSGSTGTPQGFVRNHRDLLRRAQVDAGFLGVQPADVLSGLYAFTFAGSIPDLFDSLLVGATLSLFDVKRHGFGPMADWLVNQQVSVLHLNATLLRLFLDQLPPGTQFPHLRFVNPSQRLYRADVNRLWQCLPAHAVVGHQYALTEAGPVARWVLGRTTAWQGDIVPAGYGVPGVEIQIVDEHDHPLAPGAVGEIVVRSPYLATPAWHNAQPVATRFDQPPPTGGLRRYRTGDLGRWTTTGQLELLGRRDTAVKVRGHRVVLAEIEAVLESMAEVRQAVVITTPDAGGDLRLVAYIDAPAASAALAEVLVQRLRRILPDYMVPARIVVLDHLPRLANGKVDRHALPPVGTQRPPLVTPFRPVGSALEATVAAIWTQVLGIDKVGIDDKFIELGGHSLQAAQIVNRVVQTCQVELPLRVLFDAPTVAEMAAVVAQQQAGVAARPWVPPSHLPGHTGQLSFAQERMWFVQQLAPDASTYNEVQVLHLAGPLDTAALRQCLDQIVQRHSVLRTTYQLQTDGPRAVVNSFVAVSLDLVDLGGLPAQQRRTEALRQIAAVRGQPFDLGCDLMLRPRLYRLAHDEHLLAMVIHRIATDGWSSRVLRAELMSAYRAVVAGRSPELPALSVQYADFAAWQRQRLTGEPLARLLAYWGQRLSGMPALNLLGDRPRPVVPSQRAGVAHFQVPGDTTRRLRQLAQDSEVTLYVLLLTAYAVLLHRYAGQEDITIGTPVANRNLAALEPLIGRFANTLVIRCDLTGDPSLRALLARVRAVVLEAYDQQELPFEKLVEELNPVRDLRQNPLVQVMFQLASHETLVWNLDALVMTLVPVDAETSEFDLRLAMIEHGNELRGRFEYARDLFDLGTIERMIGHFLVLLAGMADHPAERISHLPLLTPVEQEHLRFMGRGPTVEYPHDRCIHELFEEQAAATPHAVAVVAGERRLTYAELNRQANRVAQALRHRGVCVEDLVAICLPRSLDLIVAMLGILKSGAAYLPLDLREPWERLNFMLHDAGAVLLLAQAADVPTLTGAGVPVLSLDALGDDVLPAETVNSGNVAAAANLAYVMYTSGSTGQPKGTEICHRAVNRLLFGVDYVELNSQTVLLQLAPATFDAATFEIWGALLHGGCLVLAPDGPPDLAQIEELIVRHHVSTLWLTSSLFNVVVDHRPMLLAHLRQLLTGGEALSPRHVHQALQHLAPEARLVNGYGPTESTTFACCYQVPHELSASTTSIPIGRPIANTAVYVLDPHGQPVPIGVPGELHIGGDGLARGYRHRPALTAARFVVNPFVDPTRPTRLYRTGDQVRWLADGHLEFLGRLDQQVKVRGYRVEPAEVEAALQRHPAVQACAVTAIPDPTGGQRLVAYWVPAVGQPVSASELTAHLSTRLPGYMLPAQLIELDALPLTAGGKLDRQSLATHGAAPATSPPPGVPRTPLEQALIAIWTAVLSGVEVGIHDNFFALGGHSLRAVQVVARVREQFGIDVPLRTIFDDPTVAGMALRLQPLLDQVCATPAPREEFVL